ncbi:MAG: nucleotidyltransferase family protein [Elusimicrobia bacterium]|nr:nucleotidyltransferase family protein [Elusimicrobiota bacterium]
MTPSRAFLLAAGLGTRLKPLTDKVPKCLLPVGGRPMLHWWLRALEKAGVREVLLNTHHHREQVEEFVGKSDHGPRIRLFHEPRLLGSAGTLAANRAFAADGDFWIAYADTLVAADLGGLLRLHELRRPPLTLGLFKAPEPRACGIVELDADGRVLSFEEKPARPRSDLACAGVFLASARFWEAVPGGAGDLGRDVVPRLTGRAYGRLLEGEVIDIGTPQACAEVRTKWAGPELDRLFA